MDVICEQCKNKLTISDDKIPAGKTATLRCPKCKNKILIKSEKKSAEPERKPDEKEKSIIDEAASLDQLISDSYDVVDKPFDFVEEEGKTALVCESNSDFKKKITTVLDFMEYHISAVDSSRDAIKKLRYHVYDAIIVNDEFDTRNPESNGVLIYVARLPMAVRRRIFVGMITRRFSSLDSMMTLHNSVNLMINAEHMNDLDRVLRHGISEHEMFYKVYKETLKNTGRI